MVLIEPSIGMVVGLPRRGLRSRAAARNVLDVTLASRKRCLKKPWPAFTFSCAGRRRAAGIAHGKAAEGTALRKPKNMQRVVATGCMPHRRGIA
jgi:hypothetical protein